MIYQGFPYLSTIDPKIQEELRKRQTLESRERNIDAWAKVTSGVKKKETNTLYYLAGTINNTSQNPDNYEFRDLYNVGDNRPIGGMTSLDVSYKTIYGGIREATVKWSVNNLFQFNEAAPYFLCPGRTMLIEWGWSDGSSDHALLQSQYDDMKQEKGQQAYSYLNARTVANNGLYDGMLGIVTNYDFSLREDGGYDCTTFVTSQGSLMYGLNLINQVVVKDGSAADSQVDMKNLVDMYLIDIATNEWQTARNKKRKILQTLTFKDKEEENAVYFDCQVYIDGKESNDVSNRFVTWGFIEEVIVNYCMGIKYKSNSKPLFMLRSIDNNDPSYNSVKILNHPSLRSSDLTKFFICNPDAPDSSMLKFGESTEKVDSAITNFGYLRHMYVNLDLVKKAFTEHDTLSEALISILDQINGAAINFWDFSIKIDEPTQTARIIDAHFVNADLKQKLTDAKLKPESDLKDIFMFRVYGGTGFIKSISFDSKLSQDIKLTSLYTVNKDEQSKIIFNNDNDSFSSLWNKGQQYTDHFLDILFYDVPKPGEVKETITAHESVYGGVNAHFSDALTSKCLPKRKQIPTIATATLAPSENFIWWGGNETEYMKLEIYGSTGNNAKNTYIIPADFEMDIEGIGGIKIGDTFLVDALPDMYLETSVLRVTGVDHTITKNLWTTKIKAMLAVADFNRKASTVRGNIGGVLKPGKVIIPTSPDLTVSDKKVLKWIKNNMGPTLRRYASGLYTEDILAGIMWTEARGPIGTFGVAQKQTAQQVCSQIKNPDASNIAYSFFQFNYNGVSNEYKNWIDGGGWKRPHEATEKAVQLLLSKEKYIRSNVSLSSQDLLKATISSYNQGEGNIVNQLKSGQTVDTLNNAQYTVNVLKGAKDYQAM